MACFYTVEKLGTNLEVVSRGLPWKWFDNVMLVLYMVSVKHVIMVKVYMLCSKVMLKIFKVSENSKKSWLIISAICRSEASPGGPDSVLKWWRTWISKLTLEEFQVRTFVFWVEDVHFPISLLSIQVIYGNKNNLIPPKKVVPEKLSGEQS